MLVNLYWVSSVAELANLNWLKIADLAVKLILLDQFANLGVGYI